jgi:hypothetical protein
MKSKLDPVNLNKEFENEKKPNPYLGDNYKHTCLSVLRLQVFYKG